MSTLTIFGCSHSNNGPSPTYADILEVDGFKVKNFAHPGRGNEYILAKLIQYLRIADIMPITDNDRQIIVQLTYADRLGEIWNDEWDNIGPFYTKSKTKNYYNLHYHDEEITQESQKKIREKVTEEYMREKYTNIQYCIYSLFKLHNIRNFHIMAAEHQLPERCFQLIPELKQNYVNAYVGMNPNPKYKINIIPADQNVDRIRFDRHMDIDQHTFLAKKLNKRIRSNTLSENTLKYLAEVEEFIANFPCIETREQYKRCIDEARLIKEKYLNNNKKPMKKLDPFIYE